MTATMKEKSPSCPSLGHAKSSGLTEVSEAGGRSADVTQGLVPKRTEGEGRGTIGDVLFTFCSLMAGGEHSKFFLS